MTIKNNMLTVIVPRLPPSVDGLGDYGLNLAKQMRKDFGVDTLFIVGDHLWNGAPLVEGFEVRKVAGRTKKDLLSILPLNAPVLLHYVGYGYARRGSPLWLVAALSEWKHSADKNCITIFHECYAFGPIWTSQFWTSPLQKFLASKLGLISEHCLTSRKKYSELISKLTNGKHSNVLHLPVFSNIGEPQALPCLGERVRRIVVFGSKGSRSRVYTESKDVLSQMCQKFKIKEIFDIGPLVDFEIQDVDGIPVKVLGVKDPKEISEILSKSMIGVINYPPEYLAKSGIFAAYCSHRMLPVVAHSQKETIIEDDLRESVHFWQGNIEYPLSTTLFEAQQVADAAYNWYLSHRLSVHAKKLNDYI